MSAFTAKVWQFDKAPRRVTLKGDKTKKVEPAQHIIEFPGGAVEVSRCEDGSYWAHIIVNNAQTVDDTEGRLSAIGEVEDTRIDFTDPKIGACSITRLGGDGRHESFDQIAVLIRPVKR